MAADTTPVPKVKYTECGQCGMVVHPAEYHPYAACLMFQSCKDGEVVRANLDAVRRAQPAPAASPAPLTRSQINRLSGEAQIAFCLDKQPTYEVALARAIEAAHGIKPKS